MPDIISIPVLLISILVLLVGYVIYDIFYQKKRSNDLHRKNCELGSLIFQEKSEHRSLEIDHKNIKNQLNFLKKHISGPTTTCHSIKVKQEELIAIISYNESMDEFKMTLYKWNATEIIEVVSVIYSLHNYKVLNSLSFIGNKDYNTSIPVYVELLLCKIPRCGYGSALMSFLCDYMRIHGFTIITGNITDRQHFLEPKYVIRFYKSLGFKFYYTPNSSFYGIIIKELNRKGKFFRLNQMIDKI